MGSKKMLGPCPSPSSCSPVDRPRGAGQTPFSSKPSFSQVLGPQCQRRSRGQGESLSQEKGVKKCVCATCLSPLHGLPSLSILPISAFPKGPRGASSRTRERHELELAGMEKPAGDEGTVWNAEGLFCQKQPRWSVFGSAFLLERLLNTALWR